MKILVWIRGGERAIHMQYEYTDGRDWKVKMLGVARCLGRIRNLVAIVSPGEM